MDASGPVITLTTDFGTSDAYVAEMKGVILSINPTATIVDVSHEVRPHSIQEGAFVLGSTYRYFPEGTVHVAVVDPGVGSKRRAIVLSTPSCRFVAPDNGILSFVLGQLQPTRGNESRKPFERHTFKLGGEIEAFVLDKPGFWLPEVSRTFHGRDIFAPVAAHLSLATKPEEMGTRVDSIEAFHIPRPERRADGSVVGHVIHTDRFGNLVTSFRLDDVTDKARIEVRGRVIEGLSPSYAEGPALLAIWGSAGYLEIAAKNSNAAEELGVAVGGEVRVWAS